MGTLSEELLKLGLLSPERHARHTAEETIRDEAERQKNHSQLTAKSRRPANLLLLEHAESVSDFKQTALGVLIEHPEAIADVVRFAHQMRGKPGGKRLIWLMYKIRDGLAKLSAEEQERFLRRALRKAGGTLEPLKP